MSEGGREFRINPPPPFERKDQDDLCPAVVHQRGPLKVGDGGGGGGWGNCFWLRAKDRSKGVGGFPPKRNYGSYISTQLESHLKWFISVRKTGFSFNAAREKRILRENNILNNTFFLPR